MNRDEIILQILAGKPYTYPSTLKKARIYSITAIIRTRPMCDLFIVKADDLKHVCGVYNEAHISEIIDKVLNNQPQSSFRIR